MPQPWKQICAVHDTTAFRNIGSSVDGVGCYADRALLLPVPLAVIGEGIEASYLEWLKSPNVALGPSEVIKVNGPNLFDGLEADPFALEKVEAFLRHNGLIQPFVMTVEIQEFFRRHSIGRRHIDGAPLDVSRRMNDKADLRRMAESMGLGRVAFLPHYATRNAQSVMSTVKKYLGLPPDELDFVVVKRTNLAGGDGMLFLYRGEPFEEKVVAYLREHHANDIRVIARDKTGKTVAESMTRERAEVSRLVNEFLSRPLDVVHDVIASGTDLLGNMWTPAMTRSDNVEARLGSFLTKHLDNEFIVEYGINCDEYSTQLMIDEGKGMHFLGVTRQIMEKGTGRHLGNALTRHRHPDRISSEDWNTFVQYSRALAGQAHEQINGYSGTIGFDFLRRKGGPNDGRIYVSESNGRQTAATYPIAISHQMVGRRREFTIGPTNTPNWGVVMLNALPTTTRSFDEMKELLEREKLLFKDTIGAIPFNIRLMKLPKPQCGIITVADSIGEAEMMMEAVKQALVR